MGRSGGSVGARLFFIATATAAITTLGFAGGPVSVQAREVAVANGQVYVIQAVPGVTMDVSIDGKELRRGVAVGAVLGPLSLASGIHRVEFSGGRMKSDVVSTFKVAPGSSSDVVIHLPAQVGGAPIVNLYRTPDKPIAPGKARVLLAHTATVPPADVRIDGKVVFTNIANGEFATGDLPAGTHKVALLPTGQSTNPILGPLSVTLPTGTITMAYAYGTPTNGSMNAIVHRETLSSTGMVAPSAIDTGMVGLAANFRVTTFAVNAGPAARTPHR
jgi:hypothetical protein